MFCPQCGSSHSDDLKFCKACGANLFAVRKVVASRGADEKFNWNKTWLAEMMMSGEESVRRTAEIERLQGITPESKRRNEIKAGVITASVGISLLITLFILMQGIVLSGRVSEAAAVILSRIWIVGLIPLLVGAALIINGVFVSKRSENSDDRRSTTLPPELADRNDADFLPRADTNPLAREVFSVTDETTRHLEEPVRAERMPDRK